MKKPPILAAALLSVLLLSGCHSGDHPASPAPAPSPTSAGDSQDTTGTFRPMIGVNGKVGIGIDLGNGLTMSPSGGLGFGF